MATLSLCMIVKNEARFLPGCLKSIRNVVDEIVIVDTGSTDETVKIAKQFGAKVHHFDWNNSFAEARNEAIRYATSDYILWMDADERLNKGDVRQLSFLKQRLPSEKDIAYAVEILNYRQGRWPESAFQTRIFPNLPGIEFRGDICEQISFSLAERGVKFEVSRVKIRHLGYLTSQIWQAKIQRNLPFLKKALKERVATGEFSWDIHYYLGMSYLNLNELWLAQEHLMQVLNEDCRFKNPFFYISAAVHLSDLLQKEGESHQALQILLKLKNEFPHNDFVLYHLGNLFFQQEDFQKAIETLSQCRPENIQLGIVPVSKRDYVFNYYETLGFCYEALNEIEEAIYMFKRALGVKSRALGLMAHLSSILLFKTNKTEEATSYLIKGIKLAEKEGIPTKGQEIYIALCLMLAVVLAKQCRIEECVFVAERLLKSINLPATKVIHKLDELIGIYQDIGENLKEKGFIWANLAFETAKGLKELPDYAEKK